MRVIGFHCQDDLLVDSDGNTEHSDYLGFLLADRPDSIKVFYNLDWAVARLVYLLEIPEDQIRKFWSTSKLYHRAHTVFFVPHRYLSVKYGKHFGEATFSDVYQYDPSLTFEIDALEAAKKAAEIGTQVYETLRMLNLSPTSLSSPISVYQKEILSTLDLPTYKDMPAEVSMYAHKALHGGWQEAYQVGHFPQVYDYDLNSAFSFHTMNLIDTRRGKWIKSDKFYSPKSAPYGFCDGTVAVDKDFNPCVTTVEIESGGEKTTIDITPTGQRPDCKTNASIAHLYDTHTGRFKISSAWYWFPDGPLVYPLKEYIERLFEWKSYLKGFQREIIKRILVGLTGKLGETFKSEDQPFGRLANFAWYSWVQDATKLQDADFVISNHAEDALLSIAVDGCTFNRKIEIPNSYDIGQWRLNTCAPAFVVSSGVGCIKGKGGKGAFSLTYDWLKSQIESNPEATEYTMKKTTPITIGYAIKFNKLDKLGELETTERAVILNEIKRFYPERPDKGSDLLNQYESSALDMSVVEAEKYFSIPDK